ncbi:MAG TPA: phage head closure protein [Noviherbaspirillum sp.]|jgi:SPP1 family predicted phage head-tail adaptor|uniref:phage head closure protein n=1 Tax=Noviherbaspirillum sp. TaxID=1926288 RepID=UPI002F94F292
MDASKLKHRVTIQKRGVSQDPDGELSDGWVDVAVVWADIRHQSGLETMKGGAEASVVRASIRIRYREGITSGMRAVHGGITYDIKAPLPDLARKEHVDLVCEVVS